MKNNSVKISGRIAAIIEKKNVTITVIAIGRKNKDKFILIPQNSLTTNVLKVLKLYPL